MSSPASSPENTAVTRNHEACYHSSRAYQYSLHSVGWFAPVWFVISFMIKDTSVLTVPFTQRNVPLLRSVIPIIALLYKMRTATNSSIAVRRARMIGNATPTIAREEDAMTAVILATMPRPGHLTSLWALPVLDSEINAASRNVERNMQCIDNTVIMQMGGHGPFPVQNGPSRR
ncbi:hypothetical protein LB506_010760 [Fusarium annulatum]|nr:hypothetical protein LB506_010760 [Fusarium annulatum]